VAQAFELADEPASVALGVLVVAALEVELAELGRGSSSEHRDLSEPEIPASGQPRPMNGIFVAITVMNCTLAARGKVAM
jgi:hypothetical protein